MSNSPEEKKIIVDEDWKSQVEAEKEAALKAEKSEPAESSKEAAAPKDVPFPPASLEILIASLAAQAMVSLGLLPNPLTNKLERMPNQAKHLIDMLGMLEEKTNGNRTEQESAVLDDTLHRLRMAYVTMGQSPAQPE
ncbi:MAG: DUF1844 domain-containing protein [Thermoguttaceae bacterium]|jgi:hypothetical protein